MKKKKTSKTAKSIKKVVKMARLDANRLTKHIPSKKKAVSFQASTHSSFRGFDIANNSIERTSDFCSKCISDSCGLRDCKLQVFSLGNNEKILSGGLCPKGNTHPVKGKAPNYIEMYKSILQKHLDALSSSTNALPQNDTQRILISRSLTFLNERGVFFSAIYRALGFEIILSPESDDAISTLGKSYAHSECCYPIILAHGHAAHLIKFLRKGKDKFFLPNIISAKNQKLTFCPYVSSAGYVIRGNLGIEAEDALLPKFFFDNPAHPIAESVLEDLQRAYPQKQFNLRQVQSAVTEAHKKQQAFLDEVYTKGKTILDSLTKRKEKVFFGIARGYTILDKKASSGVEELFVSQGLHFLPVLFFNYDSIDEAPFVEHMYWFQGRKIIQANLAVATNPLLYAVRLTNFNCGPDSMLLPHEEDIMKKAGKPHLVLETDGHNSNAQFGTRISANYEVVKNHLAKLVTLSKLTSSKPAALDIEKRIIGLPYMGNSSDVVAAAFRAAGLSAEVMPTRCPDSILLAKKNVNNNTCRPFSFQVGDHLAWLGSIKKRGLDPNAHAATFLPKSGGPCRFGQYSVMLRKIFDNNGFEGVPIVDPSDSAGYQNIGVSKEKTSLIAPLAFKGMLANDILMNVLLRVRPYEKEKGLASRIYGEAHIRLCELIEQKASLSTLRQFMQEYATKFSQALSTEKRKPIVLMIGEIFIRCSEPANDDSVLMLEKHGLEVILEPSVAWMDYINRVNVREAWRNKKYSSLPSFWVKHTYMHGAGKVLIQPFKQLLLQREAHNPMDLIDEAEKDLVYSYDVKGEGSISIGTLYAFIKGKLPVDGVYQVGPFGCMQETVATSRIQALLQEKIRNSHDSKEVLLPYLYAVFGESQLSNLDAEIALFAENCRLRRELRADL